MGNKTNVLLPCRAMHNGSTNNNATKMAAMERAAASCILIAFLMDEDDGKRMRSRQKLD